jgi:hypothetical protein
VILTCEVVCHGCLLVCVKSTQVHLQQQTGTSITTNEPRKDHAVTTALLSGCLAWPKLCCQQCNPVANRVVSHTKSISSADGAALQVDGINRELLADQLGVITGLTGMRTCLPLLQMCASNLRVRLCWVTPL